MATPQLIRVINRARHHRPPYLRHLCVGKAVRDAFSIDPHGLATIAMPKERKEQSRRLDANHPAFTGTTCAHFTGELPAGVNDRIGQLRREGVGATALRDARAELEARLTPAAPPQPPAIPAAAPTGVLRAVCSIPAT